MIIEIDRNLFLLLTVLLLVGVKLVFLKITITDDAIKLLCFFVRGFNGAGRVKTIN